MKKVIVILAVMLMTLGMSMTALADYKLPELLPEKGYVKVNQDETKTIKIKLNNVDYDNYTPHCEATDKLICVPEITKYDDEYITVKVKARGTATTTVKVWIEGYERSAAYFMVKSFRKDSETVNGVTFDHYRVMTGLEGEAAYIKDISFDGTKYWFEFEQIDMGDNTGDEVTYRLNCYENDDDFISTEKLECTGVGVDEGKKNTYKIGVRLPGDTSRVKIVSDDI